MVHQGAPGPAPAGRPRARLWWVAPVVVAAAGGGFALGRLSAPDGAVAVRTEVTTTTVTAEAAAPASAPTSAWPSAPATAAIGSGVHVVGRDVQPGQYRTEGPRTPGAICYWARLEGTTGDYTEIIANGGAGEPTTVTIQEGDVGFKTTGCADWVKVG
ncbi:hypothetical protein GCM10009660_38260 [Catellatospora bangladeshensis]